MSFHLSTSKLDYSKNTACIFCEICPGNDELDFMAIFQQCVGLWEFFSTVSGIRVVLAFTRWRRCGCFLIIDRNCAGRKKADTGVKRALFYSIRSPVMEEEKG